MKVMVLWGRGGQATVGLTLYKSWFYEGGGVLGEVPSGSKSVGFTE